MTYEVTKEIQGLSDLSVYPNPPLYVVRIFNSAYSVYHALFNYFPCRLVGITGLSLLFSTASEHPASLPQHLHREAAT